RIRSPGPQDRRPRLRAWLGEGGLVQGYRGQHPLHPREPRLSPGSRMPTAFTLAAASVAPSGPAPRVVALRAPPVVAGRDELLAGLRVPNASIPPKYFYDTLGSALFEAITELDEYYPTRAERSILAA